MIIKTKSELENALKNKVQHFEVEGELAENLKKGQKITTLGKFSLAALIASLAGVAAAPVTGGIAGVIGATGAASVAALTGLEIAVIMAVAFVGSGMLIALFKGYDVEYEIDLSGKTRAKFTRKT
ncbi:MAG: hypothetical protein Q4A06_05390 [Cardiobacteriaceae bacterium]|nr:hypothetical protein [Cardiobacteriaceae bacterium]